MKLLVFANMQCMSFKLINQSYYNKRVLHQYKSCNPILFWTNVNLVTHFLGQSSTIWRVHLYFNRMFGIHFPFSFSYRRLGWRHTGKLAAPKTCHCGFHIVIIRRLAHRLQYLITLTRSWTQLRASSSTGSHWATRPPFASNQANQKQDPVSR